MSDLGLSNLAKLKARLLPASMSAITTYDTKLTQLGRGIAGLMERHCNRLWKRTAAEVDLFTADRLTWVLRRLPVESISTVEIKSDETTGFVSAGTVAAALVTWDARSGLVNFGNVQGDENTWIRITYTGGYFYETLEPADVGYPTSQPAAATLVPYDVEEAYYLQCLSVWKVMDKLGANLSSDGGGSDKLLGLSLAGLDLVPMVKAMLAPFRRMAIT